jgi:hypothetical protein
MYKIIYCLVLALALCGCSEKKKTSKYRLEKIKIQTHEHMNNDMSMPVDLVLIYDDELLEKLSSMSATEYFQKISDIYMQNISNMKIYRFEPYPGQSTEIYEIDYHNSKKPVGAIVFIRYNYNLSDYASGNIKELGNKFVVTNYSNIQLFLGQNFASIAPTITKINKKRKNLKKKPQKNPVYLKEDV